MTPETNELRIAFVDAYEPHVRERLISLNVPANNDLDRAIAMGRAWLDDELERLSGLRFEQQQRGPLELFQEAMRFPTAVLVDLEVDPVIRDEVVTNALPGDRFGLAPAASHELGETAWQTHLRWGAAKAAAVRIPKRVGVLTRNLMDRSKLDAALDHGGFDSVAIRDTFPEGLSVALIDFEHPSAPETVRASLAAGVMCVVYGPHVDEESMAAFKELGADRVIPRSQVLRDPTSFVATLR